MEQTEVNRHASEGAGRAARGGGRGAEQPTQSEAAVGWGGRGGKGGRREG